MKIKLYHFYLYGAWIMAFVTAGTFLGYLVSWDTLNIGFKLRAIGYIALNLLFFFMFSYLYSQAKKQEKQTQDLTNMLDDLVENAKHK